MKFGSKWTNLDKFESCQAFDEIPVRDLHGKIGHCLVVHKFELVPVLVYAVYVTYKAPSAAQLSWYCLIWHKFDSYINPLCWGTCLWGIVTNVGPGMKNIPLFRYVRFNFHYILWDFQTIWFLTWKIFLWFLTTFAASKLYLLCKHGSRKHPCKFPPWQIPTLTTPPPQSISGWLPQDNKGPENPTE